MALHKIGIRVDEKQSSPTYGSVTYDWACLRPKRDVDPLPAKLQWFSKQGQFTIRFANGSPLTGKSEIPSHQENDGWETSEVEIKSDASPGVYHYRVLVKVGDDEFRDDNCPSVVIR
jgi:hypothetical protein